MLADQPGGVGLDDRVPVNSLEPQRQRAAGGLRAAARRSRARPRRPAPPRRGRGGRVPTCTRGSCCTPAAALTVQLPNRRAAPTRPSPSRSSSEKATATRPRSVSISSAGTGGTVRLPQHRRHLRRRCRCTPLSPPAAVTPHRRSRSAKLPRTAHAARRVLLTGAPARGSRRARRRPRVRSGASPVQRRPAATPCGGARRRCARLARAAACDARELEVRLREEAERGGRVHVGGRRLARHLEVARVDRRGRGWRTARTARPPPRRVLRGVGDQA